MALPELIREKTQSGSCWKTMLSSLRSQNNPPRTVVIISNVPEIQDNIFVQFPNKENIVFFHSSIIYVYFFDSQIFSQGFFSLQISDVFGNCV